MSFFWRVSFDERIHGRLDGWMENGRFMPCVISLSLFLCSLPAFFVAEEGFCPPPPPRPIFWPTQNLHFFAGMIQFQGDGFVFSPFYFLVPCFFFVCVSVSLCVCVVCHVMSRWSHIQVSFFFHTLLFYTHSITYLNHLLARIIFFFF